MDGLASSCLWSMARKVCNKKLSEPSLRQKLNAIQKERARRRISGRLAWDNTRLERRERRLSHRYCWLDHEPPSEPTM